MLGLYRCDGWYNMSLQYRMFLHVDNSDSPSIVEQSQQGHDSSCYTLLAVIPSSVKYPVPYACWLAPCNSGYILLHFLVTCFSVSLYSPCSSLLPLLLLPSTGALQPLLFRLFSQ